MTVKAIRREKGHAAKIEFENGESILLDLDLLAEKCIHEGDALGEEQIKEYLAESEYIRAKSRALWLLDRYTYTERRLLEKLKAARFGAEAAKKAVARLKELGLLDDKALAGRYAEDFAARGVSKREAYAKLLQKGFKSQDIKEALEDAVFDEESQLKALIERKYAARLAAGERDKVFAALVRKGFSYRAVRDALRSRGEELEYNGDE